MECLKVILVLDVRPSSVVILVQIFLIFLVGGIILGIKIRTQLGWLLGQF